MPRLITTAVTLVALLAGCVGEPPPDEAKKAGLKREFFTRDNHDYFADMDQVRTSDGQLQRLDLTEEEIEGRNDWMMWTGGNEAFWDWLARNGYGTMDLLKLIDSNLRQSRWDDAGLVNEPGTRDPLSTETNTYEGDDAAYGIRFARPENSSVQPNEAIYGRPSGVVGLRLFKNPEFIGDAKARWIANEKADPGKFYKDEEYALRPDTIRPFRVGMSCAFCHAAPHPLNPPPYPKSPNWEHLSGTIGNQFLRPRASFGNVLKPDNYLYHVLDSQMPGTIDTSLVASDNINNANTMNAVFGLGFRLTRAKNNPSEVLSADTEGYEGLWSKQHKLYDPSWDTNPRYVARVLVDGSDSVGAWIALARVYLNIGTYHQQWIRLHNPFLGFRPQEPFKLKDCEANSVYWQATEDRVDGMLAFFLKSTAPMNLNTVITLANPEDQAETKVGNPWDPQFERGRAVFARTCIACHSSIQPGDMAEVMTSPYEHGGGDAELKKWYENTKPDAYASYTPTDDMATMQQAEGGLRLTLDDLAQLARGTGFLPNGYQKWAARAVEQPDFWKYNYLSTDQRIPVTLTRTNSARAMATNARHGQMWEDFASLTYKELDSVGRISYRDPFTGSTKSFEAPSGGPGYYRVPSLISAWATAPFLHNNALGNFNNDPSVSGRLEAFDDAIRRLLWPERRAVATLGSIASAPVSQEHVDRDQGWIWRTTTESSLTFRGYHLPGLLAGITGFTPAWIQLLPWLPSLALIVLAVLLFTQRQLNELGEKFRNYFKLTAKFVDSAYMWGGGISFLLMIATFVLIIRFWPELTFIDRMLKWPLPAVRIVSLVFPVFFAAVTLLLLRRVLPAWTRTLHIAHWVGAVALVMAVLLGATVGRALAGHGRGVSIGPFPKAMPVNVIANTRADASFKQLAAIAGSVQTYFKMAEDAETDDQKLVLFERLVAPQLMAASKCPDFVMDRGHDYVFLKNLSDADKEALIDLLKTL